MTVYTCALSGQDHKVSQIPAVAEGQTQVANQPAVLLEAVVQTW